MSDADSDLRLINEIPFAQDQPVQTRDSIQARVRELLKEAGAVTAQDVIMLGCTGLTACFNSINSNSAISQAAFVRSNMAGAGFGLPCYIAPSRYCLVHNTIGGLQQGQWARHPAAVPLCSRDLTADEQNHAAVVRTMIDPDSTQATKDLSGAKEEQSDRSQVALNASFVCPEHAKPLWNCRFCLAAALIQGPYQPDVWLEVDTASADVESLQQILRENTVNRIKMYVAVKHWARKLVEVQDE